MTLSQSVLVTTMLWAWYTCFLRCWPLCKLCICTLIRVSWRISNLDWLLLYFVQKCILSNKSFSSSSQVWSFLCLRFSEVANRRRMTFRNSPRRPLSHITREGTPVPKSSSPVTAPEVSPTVVYPGHWRFYDLPKLHTATDDGTTNIYKYMYTAVVTRGDVMSSVMLIRHFTLPQQATYSKQTATPGGSYFSTCLPSFDVILCHEMRKIFTMRVATKTGDKKVE